MEQPMIHDKGPGKSAFWIQSITKRLQEIHERLDRECGFLLFEGYPIEDMVLVTREEAFGLQKEIWYDPFHEIIDALPGEIPNWSQAQRKYQVRFI